MRIDLNIYISATGQYKVHVFPALTVEYIPPFKGELPMIAFTADGKGEVTHGRKVYVESMHHISLEWLIFGTHLTV